jgi:AcrR family transcriptional regulator
VSQPDPAHAAETAERKRWAPALRRRQLLAVAEEVFTRLGYQGAAVDDIARAAGVTRTLIYKYFADKDEIYLECLRAARSELEAAFITAAAGQATPHDQLRAGIGAYFAFVGDRGQRWDMLFGGGSAVAGPVAGQVADLRYETADKIAGLVLAAAPHLSEEAASAHAHAISGACEQLGKWWRRHPDVTLDAVVEHCLNATWTGLETIAGAGPAVGS